MVATVPIVQAVLRASSMNFLAHPESGHRNRSTVQRFNGSTVQTFNDRFAEGSIVPAVPIVPDVQAKRTTSQSDL
jgi:hypothetical protein